MKLHPGTGFFADDPQFRKFFATINELGVPVLTHSGFWPLRSKPCDPIHFDDLLVEFPNLKIVFAHLGRGWQDLLFEMGAHRPGVATDFSGWQMHAQRDHADFCHNVRRALDALGPGRVLFGTDGPFLRPVISSKDWVQMVRDLPQKAPEGLTFTEAEIEAILGGAAAFLGVAD